MLMSMILFFNFVIRKHTPFSFPLTFFYYFNPIFSHRFYDCFFFFLFSKILFCLYSHKIFKFFHIFFSFLFHFSPAFLVFQGSHNFFFLIYLSFLFLLALYLFALFLSIHRFSTFAISQAFHTSNSLTDFTFFFLLFSLFFILLNLFYFYITTILQKGCFSFSHVLFRSKAYGSRFFLLPFVEYKLSFFGQFIFYLLSFHPYCKSSLPFFR